ncbi:MAG: FecR domain-containing protein [Acidobacteria bacterium]|nr:FecR domain-containing protein [Acidobacteriota bacterium]
MLNCRVGKALMLLSAVLSLLLVLPTVMADSKARIVRLSYVDGDVQLDRAEGQGFEKAIMNMPVVQGAKVSTAAGARAEVELEDGSTIRLTPDTTLTFPELGLRDSGQRVTSAELQKGTVYFVIRKHAGDFHVTAGSQQLEVHDNSEFRVSATPQELELAVYKGEVKMPTGAKEIKVKNGETLSLNLNDQSQPTPAKGISVARYDDWNHERDQYRDLYASTGYSGWGFSPAYSYGFADLNYYGSYLYAPGWGMMWQPFGVGPGWSPFRDGAWMWYPGAGYMWVSSYPWGWMPYRYGAWNYVPGYGWAWFPGSNWTAWAPYTPVRTAPAGYVAPQPPSGPVTTRTAIVGSGGTTIYPAGLGQPGTVLLNRNLIGPRAATVIPRPAGVAAPTIGTANTRPGTTTVVGGKSGVKTAAPASSTHSVVSMGSTHVSSGTSAGHSAGGGNGK